MSIKHKQGNRSEDRVAAALLVLGALIERKGGRRNHRAWRAAIPVAGVNAVAFYGQLGYLNVNLITAPLGIRVLIAAVLESIAVYLSWHAHLALIANDSAFRLRLFAYSIAAVIGSMNYSHYMHRDWRPTAAAVIFGLCSVLSPMLWSVHSRRAARDGLKARGEIEPHAVRLGATRWFWHAWRSAQVMWKATWIGENKPDRAIALWTARTKGSTRKSDRKPAAASVTPPPAPPAEEPRRAATVREAEAGGLAAAPAPAPAGSATAPGGWLTKGTQLVPVTDQERDLIKRLLQAEELPSARTLAADEFGGNRRAAGRVLALVNAARMNGAGHGSHNGS